MTKPPIKKYASCQMSQIVVHKENKSIFLDNHQKGKYVTTKFGWWSGQ